MKISIYLTVIIIAVGAFIGWHDFRQLAVVRATHEQLAADAARMGLVFDPLSVGATARRTRHERENHAGDAKRISAEFIVFARELETLQLNGGKPDEAMQKRILEYLDRLLSLDAAQLKILIAEIRSNTDLKDETRQNLLGFSIMTLANDHPQTALALLTESSDLFKDGFMGKHAAASALERWAKDDPLAALGWLRDHSVKYPGLLTDDAGIAILKGTATRDPARAFKLIGELGIKDPEGALDGIVRNAKTPGERTATLAALRDHLTTVTDEQTRTDMTNSSVAKLARGAVSEGFAAGSQWLASANLTPEELTRVADDLRCTPPMGGETGRWIEWVGTTLPADLADRRIQNLVRDWTQSDYQAAGKWLLATPDGPAKNPAIRSYAETLSSYEPGNAAQWAMTLPAGKERDATLLKIYQNWPRKDPMAIDAAAAFANQHGIK